MLLRSGGIALAAFHNDGMVGLQGVVFDAAVPSATDSGEHHSSVDMECSFSMVDPIFQRKGIARKLLQQVEIEARAAVDSDGFWATIHPENHASLKLYGGSGYVLKGRLLHLGVPRQLLIKPPRHSFQQLGPSSSRSGLYCDVEGATKSQSGV